MKILNLKRDFFLSVTRVLLRDTCQRSRDTFSGGDAFARLYTTGITGTLRLTLIGVETGVMGCGQRMCLRRRR